MTHGRRKIPVLLNQLIWIKRRRIYHFIWCERGFLDVLVSDPFISQKFVQKHYVEKMKNDVEEAIRITELILHISGGNIKE